MLHGMIFNDHSECKWSCTRFDWLPLRCELSLKIVLWLCVTSTSGSTSVDRICSCKVRRLNPIGLRLMPVLEGLPCSYYPWVQKSSKLVPAKTNKIDKALSEVIIPSPVTCRICTIQVPRIKSRWSCQLPTYSHSREFQIDDPFFSGTTKFVRLRFLQSCFLRKHKGHI